MRHSDRGSPPVSALRPAGTVPPSAPVTTMATDRVSSYDDLLRLLQDDGVLHQADRATRTVRIPTERGAFRGQLLMRWLDHEGVLQLIQSLPFGVSTTRAVAYLDAQNLLNHALVLSGFELHPARRVPYYRRTLQLAPRSWLLADEVRWWFGVTVRVAAELCPHLQAVAEGALQPAGLLAAAEREITRVWEP